MFCSRLSSQPPRDELRMLKVEMSFLTDEMSLLTDEIRLLTDEMRMLTDEMLVAGLDGHADGGLLAQRQGPCRFRGNREQPHTFQGLLPERHGHNQAWTHSEILDPSSYMWVLIFVPVTSGTRMPMAYDPPFRH